jgi:hypothetical protein
MKKLVDISNAPIPVKKEGPKKPVLGIVKRQIRQLKTFRILPQTVQDLKTIAEKATKVYGIEIKSSAILECIIDYMASKDEKELIKIIQSTNIRR